MRLRLQDFLQSDHEFISPCADKHDIILLLLKQFFTIFFYFESKNRKILIEGLTEKI